MPLLTLDHLTTAFGHVPLLDDASLQIEAGERIAMVGRNGTGKSTLLKIIARDLEPDAGTVWQGPGVRVSRLPQDVLEASSDTRRVQDVVAEGVHGLQHEEDWQLALRVDQTIDRLGLDADAHVHKLSGGWRRRVWLARALVAQPDVLLLDEPTNHLDIEAISWLEDLLTSLPGAVVFVTHDRAFLQRVATRLVELDRGHLTSYAPERVTKAGDRTTGVGTVSVYDEYLRRKEESLAVAAVAHDKFDKLLAQEEVWLRRGIKARRTRDEGRVKALLAMRTERAARRQAIGSVRMTMESGERSGKLVFDVDGVTKRYSGSRAPVISNFSTRIMRGDRVGVLGPNGAGKTTLMRLLVGDLTPNVGEVRLGTNVQIAYYDQQREQLDPERTVVDTVADGNDVVTVGGRSRHVHGYLEDFLFPPARARSKVKALSGGERNRLLLARLFTRPANVLVLDEPTNDLDIETLELLESQLAEFDGTVLLVSHDRAFLNNVVTSTLVCEGDGVVREYVGGYDDWVRQRGTRPSADEAPRAAAPSTADAAAAASAPSRKRLSYMEQREFDALPERIETVEAAVAALEAEIASADFYLKGAEAIRQTMARLEQERESLTAAFARWDALDSRQN
ncbi:MAG: ATP-binding cassette domain-containing protein [Acidobacteria bacterium]|nr:ATP-binding cassette domain-containing protein [Acidobacteriota bacterium]